MDHRTLDNQSLITFVTIITTAAASTGRITRVENVDNTRAGGSSIGASMGLTANDNKHVVAALSFLGQMKFL